MVVHKHNTHCHPAQVSNVKNVKLDDDAWTFCLCNTVSLPFVCIAKDCCALGLLLTCG